MGITRKKLQICLTIIIILMVSHSGICSDNIETTYRQMQETYDAERWEEAIELADGFRAQFLNSKYESSALFITAHSALYLRQLDRTRTEALRLLLTFSQSDYVDDAHYLLAQCALMQEQWDQAEEELTWVADSSADSTLRTAANHLRSELNAYREASATLAGYDPSASDFGQMRLGLILPLTGENSEFAEAFQRGFQFGWSVYGGSGEVLCYDSECNPVRAVGLIREAVRDSAVWGIIAGPDDNTQHDPAATVAMATATEMENVPFLTTLCPMDGLTTIGRNVFQGRADYHNVGNALGTLAMTMSDSSGNRLTRFGILAPLTSQGRQTARGFRELIIASGGEIIAEEGYYPGTQDLNAQLDYIRTTGFRLFYDDSLRQFYAEHQHLILETLPFHPSPQLLEPILSTENDTMAWTLSSALLDSLWETNIIEWRERIEDLQVPLDIYDGFLLILEQDRLEMIPPQFVRFNLQTQLFGGENWAQRDILNNIQNYADDLIFAEPYAVEYGEEYDRFVRLMVDDDEQINRYHLAGERAARIMVFATQDVDGPASVRLALSQIRDLNTLSGKISFVQEERVNRSVTLTHFNNGQFETVTPDATE
ncbi:MAG: ABC transporter substrate-binding protein [Candidatus Electryoneaceae bacterium]|nr:ABC transporter substrate-binding protein [Candidatus Electryoneaceae bacterium]